MTNFQRCQQATTAPACQEKGAVLQRTSYHLTLIHAATEAYHHAMKTRAIGPDWAPAHRAWLDAAETLEVTIIKQADREARHD